MAEKNSETEASSDQVSGSSAHLCAPCKKKHKENVGEFYCRECNQYQCKMCSSAHEDFDFMSGHEVMIANKVNTSEAVLDMKGYDRCEKHNKIIKFFCVEHQILCCSYCVIFEHRKCDEINNLKTEVSKGGIKCEEVLTQLNILESNAKELEVECRESISHMDAQMEQLLEQIDGVKESFEQKWTGLKDKITEQFQQTLADGTRELTRKISTCGVMLDCVRENSQFIKCVFDHGCDEQKLIASCAIQRKISSDNTQLSTERTTLCRHDYSVECSKQLKELLQTEGDMVTLAVNKMLPLVKPLKMQRLAYVNVRRGQNDNTEPFYSGMDFFADGRLVVVDNKNKKLKIMNERLEIVGTFQLNISPYDIVVMTAEKIAVTSKNEIRILHVSRTNTITLTKTMHTANYFSVCMMNDTTFLVSTYDDDRPLRMVSMEGKETEFCYLPENRYKFDSSFCTFIPNHNKLVLTDTSADSVIMFEMGNESNTKCVVKHGNIKGPRGVCVGPDDCVYVCCMYTQNIVQVSPSGKVISSHDLDTKLPYSICISKTRKTLAVSNSENGKRRLELFTFALTDVLEAGSRGTEEVK